MSIRIEGGGSKENIFSDSDNGIPLWNGESLLNLVYPVGSIYWSSNDTDPGTLFGGTWQQIKDMFVLAAGDSYSVNNTGGEKTHTLTIDEMPSHDHSFTPSGTVSSSFSGTAGTTGSMDRNQYHRHVTTDDSNSILERYDPNESKKIYQHLELQELVIISGHGLLIQTTSILLHLLEQYQVHFLELQELLAQEVLELHIIICHLI